MSNSNIPSQGLFRTRQLHFMFVCAFVFVPSSFTITGLQSVCMGLVPTHSRMNLQIKASAPVGSMCCEYTIANKPTRKIHILSDRSSTCRSVWVFLRHSGHTVWLIRLALWHVAGRDPMVVTDMAVWAVVLFSPRSQDLWLVYWRCTGGQF